MKNALYIIGCLLVFCFLVFFFNAVGLTSFKFFAPKMENARREVFENTQSYVEGKRQELTKYRLEYQRAKDPADKQAIRMTILQSCANVNPELLPYDLRSFLGSLK